MADAVTIAAALLLVGPIVGGVAVGQPAFIRFWSADRTAQLAIIREHRLGWTVLNAGFLVATLATIAGLTILAAASGGHPVRLAGLLIGTVVYAFGGAAWSVVLAVRAWMTPALADLVTAGRDTEPAETLLGAALRGLFGAYVLMTSAALLVLGATVLAGGGVAPAVAAIVTVLGLLDAIWYLRAGDLIPAVLYPPTQLVGLALLAGWT